MRGVVWTVLALTACVTSPEPSEPEATDEPVADTAETDFVDWPDSGDSDEEDTEEPVDTSLPQPIGPTPLDGTWEGTFVFLEVVPGIPNPRCEGTATFTIDGTATSHISGNLLCPEAAWDPNFDFTIADLIPIPLPFPIPDSSYGDLDGLILGQLIPDQWGRSDLVYLEVSAASMTSLSERGRFQFDGDTMTLSFDGVSGFGGFRTGRRLDIEATRVPTP